MTDRELMQQALEALAEWKEVFPDNWDAFDEQAFSALRERLAQPEQGGKTGWPAGMLQDDSRELSKSLASKPDAKRHAREAAQPAPPPEQDVPEASCGNMGPVGWLESPDGAFRANPLYKIKFPSKLLSWQVSLYTAPPQRKPLTEEQAFDLFGVCYNISVIRAIEAAHGIKEST